MRRDVAIQSMPSQSSLASPVVVFATHAARRGATLEPMRAVWNGSVSFGLVSIAVKAYAATEDRKVQFHQVHSTDGGKIRYKRYCELDEEEVPYAEIAKGYTLHNGETVILEPSDFENLPLPSTQEIDVLEFVPHEQIDPIRYARAYYLEPDKSAKPYVLLRDVLAHSDVVAVVKVAMRQREQLATIRSFQDVLVLNTMRWPDEIRSPSFASLREDVSLSDRERDMASSLVDSMTSETFDDSQYTDEYRNAVEALIEAKATGETVEAATPEREGADVIDLTEALRASMKRADDGAKRSSTASKKSTSSSPKKKAAGRGRGSATKKAKKTTSPKSKKAS